MIPSVAQSSSDPITEVLNCLIGLKIQGIQDGLTWASDHAHIDFPLLPNDTFSLGAVASLTNTSADDNFLASPSSATTDEITSIVESLVAKLSEGIRQEAIISTMVIVVWLIIALIGIIRALMIFFSAGKTRAEGGQAYIVDPETDQTRGHDTHANDLHNGVAPPTYTANPLVNKAAPYTIQPRPFPTFEPSPENQREREIQEEKISRVNAVHNVGESMARPGHLRASSHGTYGGTTPTDEKSANPFADPKNPFGDPSGR